MPDEKLIDPWSRGANALSAYYFGFDETGVREIDSVLAAVAYAGKAYHNTSYWNDDPPYDCTETCAEAIQRIANESAQALRTAVTLEERLLQIEQSGYGLAISRPHTTTGLRWRIELEDDNCVDWEWLGDTLVEAVNNCMADLEPRTGGQGVMPATTLLSRDVTPTHGPAAGTCTCNARPGGALEVIRCPVHDPMAED